MLNLKIFRRAAIPLPAKPGSPLAVFFMDMLPYLKNSLKNPKTIFSTDNANMH